jgi:hypothetical protein
VSGEASQAWRACVKEGWRQFTWDISAVISWVVVTAAMRSAHFSAAFSAASRTHDPTSPRLSTL